MVICLVSWWEQQTQLRIQPTSSRYLSLEVQVHPILLSIFMESKEVLVHCKLIYFPIDLLMVNGTSLVIWNITLIIFSQILSPGALIYCWFACSLYNCFYIYDYKIRDLSAERQLKNSLVTWSFTKKLYMCISLLKMPVL